MEEEPRFILPASAAPGTGLTPETMPTPDGVTYFRLYMAAVALFDALAVAFGFYIMIAPMAARTGLPPSLSSLFSGAVWAFVGGFHLIGTLLALFSGRRRWVHSLGLVLVVLSVATCCCTPFGIPVLIAFNQADVKRFYSE